MRISHILRKSPLTQPLHVLGAFCEKLWSRRRATLKIFGNPARRISGCFAVSGPERPTLSRIKACPTHHAPVRRSGHALANEPCRCPDNGASNGNSESLARLARHHPCLRNGLVLAGGGACRRNADF